MDITINGKSGEGKSTVAIIVGAALMTHGFKPEIFDEQMDESFYTEIQHKRRLEGLKNNPPEIKIITKQETLSTLESLLISKREVMETLRRIEMSSMLKGAAVKSIELSFGEGHDSAGFPNSIQATIKFHKSKFAWLIETSLNGKQVYFNGNSLDSGLPSYTGNAYEAKQFADKDLAQLELTRNLGLHGEPVEHGFHI